MAMDAMMVTMAVDPTGPIVGRDRELAELTRAIGIGHEPTHDGVLVSGDAGIGKTRVLRELASLADRAGHTVLVGHCLDLGDGALPFQPFVEAISTIEPGERDLLVQQLPALAALTPSGVEGAGPERSEVFTALARS